MIFDLFDFLPKWITIFLIRNPVNEEDVLKIIGQIAPRGSYSRYDILLTDCDERDRKVKTFNIFSRTENDALSVRFLKLSIECIFFFKVKIHLKFSFLSFPLDQFHA